MLSLQREEEQIGFYTSQGLYDSIRLYIFRKFGGKAAHIYERGKAHASWVNICVTYIPCSHWGGVLALKSNGNWLFIPKGEL